MKKQNINFPSQDQSKRTHQSLENQKEVQLQDFQSQQLLISIKLIKKLKIIAKNKRLSELKQSNKNVNQLFKGMSQFFVNKHNRIKINREMKKKQRINRKSMTKIRMLQKQSKHKFNALKQLQGQSQINSSQLNLQSNLNLNASNYLKDQFSNNQQAESKYYCDIKSMVCYICKNKFTIIHSFYDKLCPTCGQFNLTKRFQTESLKGLTALVTGGRIKIGYQIALKLLRDGAKVYVTSRFFNDTLLRYNQQKDFQNFRDRLVILQCDFTSSQQVDKMLETIKKCQKKLDILVNNAAQTIVRPKQFYLKQIQRETLLIDLPQQMKGNLKHQKLQSTNFPSIFSSEKQRNQKQIQFKNDDSLQLLQVSTKIDHFRRDQFDQPFDLRQKNSWVQKIQQVSLKDCYTTQIINSIVPFYIIGQLKSMMKKTPQDTPSWILNVSSMQGIFNRKYKQSNHPHTNMAKASLNMITRTCAKQFSLDNIYMNSIDTGWVTEENPHHIAQKLNSISRIPLDCVDGAMRVLDPIYLGIKEKKYPFGCFLKDYKSSNW